jgi:hypothetical protein
LDPAALLVFAEADEEARVVNLPRLHAKVYIADSRVAAVTSANLTRGGLLENYEYGVLVNSESVVTGIRKDIEDYARLGNALSKPTLAEFETVALDLRSAYRAACSVSSGSAGRRFRRILRRTHESVLRAQVGKRSPTSLFGEAIRYVLLAQGPLATREMHPEIQRLLPDLCDDEQELVINGQHFGKRWKHNVRNAQQALKSRGEIELWKGRWRLCPS